MEVRILEATDASDYQAIRLEALKNNPEAFASSYEEEKAYSAEKYKIRFSEDISFTFGAFEYGLLVGVVSLVKEQKNKLKHRANVYAMYVKPEKRRLGIARRLLHSVMVKAKELDGVEQIYLSVVTSNSSAKGLYQSFGFKTYGVDEKALKIDELYYDEELMRLSINS